jgi:hypothetical protein
MTVLGKKNAKKLKQHVESEWLADPGCSPSWRNNLRADSQRLKQQCFIAIILNGCCWPRFKKSTADTASYVDESNCPHSSP